MIQEGGLDVSTVRTGCGVFRDEHSGNALHLDLPSRPASESGPLDAGLDRYFHSLCGPLALHVCTAFFQHGGFSENLHPGGGCGKFSSFGFRSSRHPEKTPFVYSAGGCAGAAVSCLSAMEAAIQRDFRGALGRQRPVCSDSCVFILRKEESLPLRFLFVDDAVLAVGHGAGTPPPSYPRVDFLFKYALRPHRGALLAAFQHASDS